MFPAKSLFSARPAASVAARSRSSAARRGNCRLSLCRHTGSLTELCQQAHRLLPQYVIATDEAAAGRFDWSALPRQTKLLLGQAGVDEVVGLPEIDIVVSAVVGSAGLTGTWAALEAGKRLLWRTKKRW